VAINISSPNTKNLRELQKDDALDALLGQLKAEQTRLADKHGKYVPLVLKIAPDLEDEQIQSIADLLRQHRMDGVIATNTTLSRAEVEGLPNANEAGGLSGAPVFERSTAVLKKLAGHLKAKCRSSASAASCRARMRSPRSTPAPASSSSTPASSIADRNWSAKSPGPSPNANAERRATGRI
jgi:hypothetical protein